MGWLKAIFAIGGGPLAWLASAASFVASAFMWCIRNWKFTLPIAILLGAFYGGMRYERSGWHKKEVVRVAKEKSDEEQRIRTNHDLQVEYEKIQGAAAVDAARREKAYGEIEKKMRDYVARNHGSTAGIGDDGLRIILDAIRSRRTH